VQRFDADLAVLLSQLERTGRQSNTLVVVTGDNGWPFPRGKANLYDPGTHQPLAVRWPARIKPGRTVGDFVSLTDLAPTFLESAGLKPLPEMTGRSFLPLLLGNESPGQRDAVFVERERHANVRAGDLGYPSRAVRTRDFLYIRNLAPERWPAGDPEKWKAVGPFGDVDAGPTKQYLLDRRNDAPVAPLFELAFGKRPAEELYDLRRDPFEMRNIANSREYAKAREQMRARLESWMKETGDPRFSDPKGPLDQPQYFGPSQD
jgi:arylsulfatase A-like enzyme